MLLDLEIWFGGVLVVLKNKLFIFVVYEFLVVIVVFSMFLYWVVILFIYYDKIFGIDILCIELVLR